LITQGRLVLSVSVTGQLVADGAVELLELEIDLSSSDVHPDSPTAEHCRRVAPAA
jgi:hypothetical protein